MKKPEEWKWSSYQGTAGLAKPHDCLTVDWVLGQFGKARNFAEKGYKDFVRAGIGGGSIWDPVKGQSILGEDSFVKSLEPYTKGAEEFREIPRIQRYLNRPELDQWFSRETEIPELADKLESPTISSPTDLKTLEETEREQILKTLSETRWRINGTKGAASILGLHPSTLRARMQKLGIRRPEMKAQH